MTACGSQEEKDRAPLLLLESTEVSHSFSLAKQIAFCCPSHSASQRMNSIFVPIKSRSFADYRAETVSFKIDIEWRNFVIKSNIQESQRDRTTSSKSDDPPGDLIPEISDYKKTEIVGKASLWVFFPVLLIFRSVQLDAIKRTGNISWIGPL